LKAKFNFIIDADFIVTLIFGLIFSNSEEDGDKEYSFEWAKKKVESVLKLNMVTNFVSVGVSL